MTVGAGNANLGEFRGDGSARTHCLLEADKARP